jgi:hypothetical protein
MPSLSPEAVKSLRNLLGDFPLYASRCLKIRTKAGSIEPLVLNKGQQHIHARLEAQKAATGRVRALILKGRQLGCSTLIGGRFYHRVAQSRGTRVFILTHEQEATDNLFGMVSRFHENVPSEVRPTTGLSNAKELFFSRLDSGYKVGTAGTKAVGRSQTIQLFHGSEVAFWPHASAHAAGVLQAVPDELGTEVILESTANGVGGFFHEKWSDAERGQGDYIPIFVPWYWQEEYRRSLPHDFSMDEEEREYAGLYGLEPEQIAWRRNKIAELKDPVLFKQEYPATAAEAFQQSGHDSYIKPELVARARKNKAEPSGPLIIGVDPAWMGADRSSMAWRRGRRLERVESKNGLDTMSLAGWVKQTIDKDKPARVFVDVGGVGAGVYDRLKEMGYGPGEKNIVRAVNFGSSPFEPPPASGGGAVNRRAEMWMKSREWLEDPAGVSIPDSDPLQADACGPGYKWDSNTRLLLEKKEDMRRRGVPSPDEWDAVALTFAEPVRPAMAEVRVRVPQFAGNWMG